MEFEDFKRNYDKVEICNMSPDSLTEDTKHQWAVNVFEGNWIRGSTAGGCRNYIGEINTSTKIFRQTDSAKRQAYLEISLDFPFLVFIF